MQVRLTIEIKQIIAKILAISLPRLLYYGYAMQLTAKLKAKKADEKYTKPIKERVVRIDNKAEIVPYKTSMIICNVSERNRRKFI